MTNGRSRWLAIEGRVATTLEDELRRETPVGHALHGRAVRAVARRQDCDDVAFEVAGAGLCVVHLTWQTETDARWPHVSFVDRLPEHDD